MELEKKDLNTKNLKDKLGDKKLEKGSFLKIFFLLLIMLLPVLGWVIAIIILFSSKKDSIKKQLSKAVLLIHLTFIILMTGVVFLIYSAFNTLKSKYPELENAIIYVKAYAKDGPEGIINALNDNGDLEILINSLDINKIAKSAEFEKMISDIDIDLLIKNLDTEKLIKSLKIDDIASLVDTEQLLEIIEPDKLIEFIDFETLINQLDSSTLESWKEIITEQNK